MYHDFYPIVTQFLLEFFSLSFTFWIVVVRFLFCFSFQWIIRWFAFIFVLCKRCHKYLYFEYEYEYLCVSCENGKRTIPNLSLIFKKKRRRNETLCAECMFTLKFHVMIHNVSGIN